MPWLDRENKPNPWQPRNLQKYNKEKQIKSNKSNTIVTGVGRGRCGVWGGCGIWGGVGRGGCGVWGGVGRGGCGVWGGVGRGGCGVWGGVGRGGCGVWGGVPSISGFCVSLGISFVGEVGKMIRGKLSSPYPDGVLLL